MPISKNIFGTYKNYIKLAVLPDIYRNELTTQYLYTENFGQIKQTAYRKVDYISLAENASYSGSIGNLMTAYCKNVLSDATKAKDFTKKIMASPSLAISTKARPSSFTAINLTIALRRSTPMPTGTKPRPASRRSRSMIGPSRLLQRVGDGHHHHLV
jgi:hypothetical protein